MALNRWGWDSYFEALWGENERENVLPSRVVAEHRGFWRVAGDFGECWAEVSGKLRSAAYESVEWPAVGDWVAVELLDDKSSAVIREVLPRRSGFVRKSPGKKITKQVIAANVDTAFLVSALDGDFNPRRMERYLAQGWASGARPVILLNKADACADARDKAAEMERVRLGTTVLIISAKTGEGFRELEKFLTPGQTLVLLGSSGVGKSTIANRLLGKAVQGVQPVREGDGRGRHTTTTRELLALPGGALLMDTPGLRELQLWDAADGVSEAFRDIDRLAVQCRFSDCGHETEPGCAVETALSAGTLDQARVENWRKLLREQEFLRRKMDPEARDKEKRRIKHLSRALRQVSRHKKWDRESG